MSYSPVAYWRLGETSGAVASDLTGSHPGAYQNSVTRGVDGAVAGDADKAARLGGGANDRVQVNPFGVSGTGLTIVGWFKAAGFGDDRFVAKATGAALANVHWSLGTHSNNRLKAQLKINGTTRELRPAVGAMSADVWYFAAMTYDGATMRVYLDGVQVGSAAYAGTASTDASVAVGLGNQPAGAGNRAFAGVLDECAVFAHALTADQISRLYGAAGGGLRGHWKLNETAGTTAADSSVQRNNGAYTGGVALAAVGPYPGPGDKAANFDGANDHVAIPNESRYDFAGPMAVAAWIRVNAFDDAEQAIVTKGNDAWRLQRNGTTSGVNFYCRGLTRNTVASVASVDDGQWHHIVGVYTGSRLQIYIDGALDNSVNSTGTIRRNNRAVAIGRNNDGRRRSFDGAIHDVRLYGRSLSPADVATIYGLAGHWKLDETGGAIANDSSGFDRNGNVAGAAIWTPGAVGNSLAFNGATRVTVPGLVTISRSVAASAWANLTTADAGGAEVVSLGDCFALRLDEGAVAHASFFNGTGVVPLTLTRSFAGSGWHHFAVVFDDDGNLFELYVDGVLAASTSTSATIAYTGRGIDTIIGSHGNGQTDRDFLGRIDDVRVYSRALRLGEVQALFNGGSPVNGIRILQWVEVR